MSSLDSRAANCARFGSSVAILVGLVGCSLTEEQFEKPRVEAPDANTDVGMLDQSSPNVASRAEDVAVERGADTTCEGKSDCRENSEGSSENSLSEESTRLRLNSSSEPSESSSATDAASTATEEASPPDANLATDSCSDGLLNGAETDVDCGGECSAQCAEGLGCEQQSDCEIGQCSVQSLCVASACEDGIANQDETAIDCGGSCAATCDAGSACRVNEDCLDRVCGEQQCANSLALCCQAARCDDSITNGEEADVDCGGSACQRCTDGQECSQASDCTNNNCFDGRCISCGSRTIDGAETDVDCGGSDPACQRCRPGQRCLINSDCQDNSCQGGFC